MNTKNNKAQNLNKWISFNDMLFSAVFSNSGYSGTIELNIEE